MNIIMVNPGHCRALYLVQCRSPLFTFAQNGTLLQANGLCIHKHVQRAFRAQLPPQIRTCIIDMSSTISYIHVHDMYVSNLAWQRQS